MTNSTYNDLLTVIQEHFSQFVIGSLIWSYAFAFYVLWATCRRAWPTMFQQPFLSTLDSTFQSAGMVFLVVFYVLLPSAGYFARWVLIGFAAAILLFIACMALFRGRTMWIRYSRFEQFAPLMCGRNCVLIGSHWYTTLCLARVMIIISTSSKHFFSALNRELPEGSFKVSDTIFAWHGATLHTYVPLKDPIQINGAIVRLYTLKPADALPVTTHIHLQ